MQSSASFSRLISVLVQPQAEGVFLHTTDERRRLPGRQTLLGLAGKLGTYILAEAQSCSAPTSSGEA